MLLTVIMQLVIIGIGLFAIDDFSRFFSQIKINQPGINTSPSWTDFMKGVAMAMVAYTGIESIAQLGSETKRPVRAVPRAIMLTMVVLIFMYLGLSFVGFSLVNPYQFGHLYEAQPVVGIVSHLPVLRQFLVPCVGILAAMTLFVAANAGLIGASRLSFSMGEHYQLPRFLYKLHPRFKTPYTALIFFAVIACIVVALSKAKISHLADLYNFGAQIAFFSTQVALIVLRIKRPDLRRPFKVPFNVKIKGREIPILAVIGAISSFAVWMLIVITKPEGRYFGFTWILIGLVMYYAYRKKQKISPTTQVVIEKIKLSQFKTEPIRKILLPLRSQAQIELMTRAIDLAKQHKAEMLILHVIEVPFSLPLETPLPHRVEMAAPVLKMAEAIARDKEVSVELEIVRARSIEEAILDIARVRAPDLMILESTSEGGQGKA
jgi:APA family basic amino acid/polyamine antiporter